LYELARNFAHDRGYAQMIGDTPELTTLAASHDATILYIPLQFACCRNDGLALPIIALQYHDIKLTINFADLKEMVNLSGDVATAQLYSALQLKASLFVDYVYLDNEERKRFAQASHEYLYEQLQFTGSESISQAQTKYRLNLNHPCKELVWNSTCGVFNQGKHFLAYNPTNVDLARVEATKRFVLRTCKYSGSAFAVGATAGNLLEFQGLTGAGSFKSDVLNNDGSRQSLYEMFQDIRAVYLNPGQFDIDNVTILGRLLSVNEFSTPTSVLFDGFTQSGDIDGDGLAINDVVLYQHDNYGCYLDGSRNPTSSAILQLNGHDRFSKRDGGYFNYVQPWQCHTNTPADGVNVYSFALNPEQHQPSGTCNFSRIDNATLNIDYDAAFPWRNGNGQFSLYATNYNVLRIMSGMGGLAYSN